MKKIFNVILAFCLLAVIFRVGAYASYENLLVNSDFENGTTNGWTMLSGVAEATSETSQSVTGTVLLTPQYCEEKCQQNRPSDTQYKFGILKTFGAIK